MGQGIKSNNHHRFRVLHITNDYSSANFGVTAVVQQLSRFLSRHNCQTMVMTPGKATSAVAPGVQVMEFPLLAGGHFWGYPKHMRTCLHSEAEKTGTLFHLHGVWTAPQWMAAWAARRHDKRVILSSYDMLSPWQWHKGRLHYLKKLIYWWLVARPAFRHLSLVHAVTPREKRVLAKLFPNKRLELIPNAIDLEEADRLAAISDKEKNPLGSHPYLLFLGRLDPQKGVDLLLEAFACNSISKDFRLVIVGSECSPAYTLKLKTLTRELGVENRVLFLGPIFGPLKWRLYRDAWAGCLPSRSDSVSIASLEFGAAALPTVTTHESGLFDWQDNGGILVRPDLHELSEALTQVFSWNEKERKDRGRKLRQLVERRYSWKAVGPLWLDLYSQIMTQ